MQLTNRVLVTWCHSSQPRLKLESPREVECAWEQGMRSKQVENGSHSSKEYKYVMFKSLLSKPVLVFLSMGREGEF